MASPDETAAVIKAVMTAVVPEDLFLGDAEKARFVFRRSAKLLHPDAGAPSPEATEAFERLTVLYEWYRTGVEPKGGVKQVIIATKKRVYSLGDLAFAGDIANFYRGRFDDSGTPVDVLLKMPRNPGDSDLLEAEAKSLKALAAVDAFPFYPTLIETFRHEDRVSKARRRVNVFTAPPGDGFVTLKDLLDIFPNGLDPRDVAWIWRRALVTLSVAHDAGLVHGAPTPDHFLIHPIDHAVVLLDWCYSVEGGQPLRAIPAGWKALYPAAEIADKAPVTEALDQFVLHKTIGLLLDPKITPKAFRAFLAGASGGSAAARPTATQTLEALDDLLWSLYGPRKYRPLILPEIN